jgi:hypothetical protein
MKVFCFLVAAFVLADLCTPAWSAQVISSSSSAAPMRHPASMTNFSCWHSVVVSPQQRLKKINFWNKLNPVWWCQNADDPKPPDWYLPGDQHRELKWSFRNPFHNFDFYVMCIADKPFVRSGRWPERNASPNGGWDQEIARRKLALLPFVSYERKWMTFYLGWREHGAFGAALRFHTRKSSGSATTSRPVKFGPQNYRPENGFNSAAPPSSLPRWEVPQPRCSAGI